MARYRKKPVVIEAVQWHKMGDHPDVGESPFLGPVVITRKAAVPVHPGDWIITALDGEVYPCKPEIFEATYEAVEVPKSRNTVNNMPL